MHSLDYLYTASRQPDSIFRHTNNSMIINSFVCGNLEILTIVWGQSFFFLLQFAALRQMVFLDFLAENVVLRYRQDTSTSVAYTYTYIYISLRVFFLNEPCSFFTRISHAHPIIIVLRCLSMFFVLPEVMRHFLYYFCRFRFALVSYFKYNIFNSKANDARVTANWLTIYRGLRVFNFRSAMPAHVSHCDSRF